jgi:hypothetical protein
LYVSNTGVVYNMSIELTTKVLSIQDLSQPQKHILTILCFRANYNYEVYSTVEKLALDCSCSIKTIERALKILRDKGYLSYTGKLAPNSRSIPIYRINLTHGLSGGGSTLTTDSQSLTDGLSVLSRTDSEGIRIDYNIKDNKKDNSKPDSLEPPKSPKDQILHNTKYHEYVKRIQQDRELKLECGNIEILEFENWKSQIYSG